MLRFNRKKEEKKNEKSVSNPPLSSAKPTNKQSPSSDKSEITENNFVVKEVSLPPEEAETKKTSLSEIENFYAFSKQTQIKYNEAQSAMKKAKIAEDELAEERVRYQKMMTLNQQRRTWDKKMNQAVVNLLENGNLKTIKDWVNKGNDSTKKPDIDTVAKAIAVENIGMVCSVLTMVDIDLNTPTARGELLINIAIQTGKVDIIQLILHDTYEDIKILNVNPNIADSCGKGPLLYLEENKVNLSNKVYLEIKNELENAIKELDELYQKLQKTVEEKLDSFKKRAEYFEHQIASSDNNSEQRKQLNEYLAEGLKMLRKEINKTILLPKQKAMLLKPFEELAQKWGINSRRSNSVSSFFAPKTQEQSEINVNVDPKSPPPSFPKVKTFRQRFKSFTYKSKSDNPLSSTFKSNQPGVKQ